MGKKRKSDAARLDEVDRQMYTSFCNAANSLSQLYSHAVSQQRLSFQAGERHALEKLYQWILTQEEERSRVAPVDILAYVQNEIEYGLEDPPVSPRVPSYLNPQVAVQQNNLGAPITGPAAIRQGARPGHLDQQAKNPFLSNALSSTVCRSLQNLTTGPSCRSSPLLPTGNPNGPNQRHNRDSSPPTSNYSMDDMHAD
uniref:Holocarboxylase synthetase n=1 Tax=Kalanchoe fedtschenkoi TaxID=63787 RepID=A0A7N0T8Z4_KALFE